MSKEVGLALSHATHSFMGFGGSTVRFYVRSFIESRVGFALGNPAGSESPHPRSARPNHNTGVDEGEAFYKVLRLSTTLNLAPNPAAWKAVQRIVTKVNPKIAQVDLDQILDSSFVRNLEATDFLAEQRKQVK